MIITINIDEPGRIDEIMSIITNEDSRNYFKLVKILEEGETFIMVEMKASW